MNKFFSGFLAFLLCGIVGLAAFLWDGWESPVTLNVVKSDVEPVAGDGQSLFEIKVNGKRGCIDVRGTVIIPPQYDQIKCGKENLLSVMVEGRVGFINRQNRYVMPPQFEYAGEFREGVAAVKGRGKYGYIDEAGNVIIRPQFAFAGEFSSGFAIVMERVTFWGFRTGNNRQFFIDKSGVEQFASLGIQNPMMFENGYAEVKVNTVWGDDTGENFTADAASDIEGKFSEGLASAWEGNHAGYRNEKGEMVIERKFKQAGEFKDGTAPVMFENGKYGFIDREGKTVIDPQYETASQFSQGLALVRLNGREGFIDRSGKVIIPINLGGVDNFKDDITMFTRQDGNTPYEETKWGYIDMTGKVIWEPTN